MLHALLIGLAGSLHCVGMCGPLMLALPLTPRERVGVWFKTSLYQLGRLTTYALIGFCFGVLGKGLMLAGVQKAFSLFSGALLLAVAFSFLPMALRINSVLFSKINAWVQSKTAIFLNKRGLSAFWILGMLNGLVPCGLVYVAAASALTTTVSAWEGAAYMFVFGLGTLPALLSLLLLGQRIPQATKQRFRYVQPILLFVAGAFLILRGLHLDLSIFSSAVPPADFECH